MVGLILKYLLLLSALLTSLTLVALPAGSRLYPLPDGALHVRLLQPDALQRPTRRYRHRTHRRA